MTNNEAIVETTAAGSGKADWSAMKEDFSEVSIKTETPPPAEESKSEEIKIDESDLKTEETKQEDKAPEITKEESTKTETESTTNESTENTENSAIEFKVEDIEGVPNVYEEGTFKALAHDLYGIDIKDESPESFKEAFVPRSEFEKIQTLTLDNVLSSVKPEVATAIKLMEMGIPAEQVLEPTREIDNYLAMDDAALLRINFELQKDLTQEIIDSEMEKLMENPQGAKIEADKLRIYLNREKTQRLEERKQYLEKYESDKQNATAFQKEQERAQITNEFNKIKTFLDQPVSKEILDAIARKYNNGLYDGELNSPASKVQYLLQKELGTQLAKHIKNKASNDAKTDARKQLLNTPPVIAGSGQKVNTSNQPTDNPWAAMAEDFKKQ